MKKLIILILSITVISISGCKKILEEKPYSFLAPDNFPLVESDADVALAGAYAPLAGAATFRGFDYYGTYMVTMQNDLLHLFGWANFGSSNAGIYEELWKLFYQGINASNSLIATLNTKDVTEDPWVTPKLAEARALRALYYYYLVRWFGDIPMPLEPTASSTISAPRTPVPEVYNAIVEDLIFAEDKLQTVANSGGRFTTGPVKALLAQVYATMAGWRRTAEGQMVQGDAKNWGLARDKAKEVLDMEMAGIYQLNPDYSQVFKNLSTDVYDPEIIFDIQFTENKWSTFPYIFGASCDCDDQNPAGGAQGGSGSVNIEWIRQLDKNDERKKWNIADYVYVSGTSWNTRTELDSNNFKIASFQKWPKYFEGYWENYLTNWPMIRLSEIKLLYAEALNEINGGPTAEAYAQINQVRYRARPLVHKNDGTVLPDIAGLNQAKFRDTLMAERAIEFVSEGYRKFDLIRWGNLKEKVDACKTQQVWTDFGGVDLRYYLCPIPQRDIDANGWQQNDGF